MSSDQMTAPGDHKIRTSRVYQAIKNHGTPAAFAKFVWSNRTPPKVQHFCWLVVQGRIKCGTNLKRKNIVEDDTCPICGADQETATHLMLACPFSSQLWGKFGMDVSSLQASTICSIARPSHIDALHFETLVHLICGSTAMESSSTTCRLWLVHLLQLSEMPLTCGNTGSLLLNALLWSNGVI